MGTIKKYNVGFWSESPLAVQTDPDMPSVEFCVRGCQDCDVKVTLSLKEIKELIDQLSTWVQECEK